MEYFRKNPFFLLIFLYIFVFHLQTVFLDNVNYSNCSSHSSNEKIKWTHSNCGASFRLYENGEEKCQKYGKEDFFCKWKCSCYTDMKSKQYSYAKIKNVLAKLSGMDTRYASTYFLVHVTMCIDRQFKDFPEEEFEE